MTQTTQASADGAWVERALLPHLDAAYNLARWLVRNPQDAEDVVQEAYLRAVKFRDGYLGGDARAWLLKIVRNASYSFLERRRPAESAEEFDETVHRETADRPTVEASMIKDAEARTVRAALERLPAAHREVLVLREFEGLSYKEIAEVVGIPVGTVMSSLARARSQLRELILRSRDQGVARGL
jgi:RNA polymerase sigma-70 factor (ECF subfamily)